VPSNRTKSASKRKKKTTWKNDKKSLKGKSFETQSDPEQGRRNPLETFSMQPIRTCQWSWSWIGRAFPSKHIQHNWSTIMEAKFKIEKTCFTLLALDPVCQVCLHWHLCGDIWWWDWTKPRRLSIIISLSNCPIIIVRLSLSNCLIIIVLLQNHLHRLLFRDNLLCEETLQLQEISF